MTYVPTNKDTVESYAETEAAKETIRWWDRDSYAILVDLPSRAKRENVRDEIRYGQGYWFSRRFSGCCPTPNTPQTSSIRRCCHHCHPCCIALTATLLLSHLGSCSNASQTSPPSPTLCLLGHFLLYQSGPLFATPFVTRRLAIAATKLASCIHPSQSRLLLLLPITSAVPDALAAALTATLVVALARARQICPSPSMLPLLPQHYCHHCHSCCYLIATLAITFILAVARCCRHRYRH